MCGIAGQIRRPGDTVSQGILDRFATALAHRGPDGQGQWLAGNVGFVQTRLAIIDLDTGDQPLHGPEDTHLIANGEIYNYLELRDMLAPQDWRTRSDCEPPLILYNRDGAGFPAALRGMYAIALHDQATGDVVLSRDPFGIKPLYVKSGSDGISFASEPQALRDGDTGAADIDPGKRAELLQLQFTTGRQTIFPGIQRLLPGETLTIRDGRIAERQRLPAWPQEPGPTLTSESEALAALDDALMDSVELHQRSDVPYGLFLSGGIDSTAVLAAMRRLNDKPVQAYTAWFPETAARDERSHARKVAEAAGAEVIEVPFGEDDFWSLLPEVAAALDDPVADYATLPTWKLAATARQDLKVVLSGEGGDELFGGYGRYRRALRHRWLGGRPMRAKGTFDGLGLLRPGLTGWRDGIAASEAAAARRVDLTPLQRLQAIDCDDWLPHDLLTKLDRCLMANGVEGRTPFLDPAVAAVAARLPDGIKIRGKQGKWLLRRWLEQQMPEAEPFAPKRGFTVPVGEWIAAKGRHLGELVARQPGIGQIADSQDIIRFFSSLKPEQGFAAWSLLFYALWHRRHGLGMLPDGDVFDVLAEAG